MQRIISNLKNRIRELEDKEIEATRHGDYEKATLYSAIKTELLDQISFIQSLIHSDISEKLKQTT